MSILRFGTGLTPINSPFDPDPQAFRPPEEPLNVLQVRLPTNFKAARFSGDADTAMLRRLAADIEAARFTDAAGTVMEIPVKLKVHESLFVPMAKWAMLIAGNYRCVGLTISAIQQAVHDNIDLSRAIYNQVVDLVLASAVVLMIWFHLINMPRQRNRLAARHLRPGRCTSVPKISNALTSWCRPLLAKGPDY